MMFVLFKSFIFVLILSIGRTTDNENVKLKNKLIQSLSHLNNILVNIGGNIDHETKMLSQIDYDLNRTHPAADRIDYNQTKDIWWKSRNPVAPADATDNENVKLQNKLTQSLTYLNDILVNIGGNIDHETKMLSQIDYDLNRTHPAADRIDYNQTKDIWRNSRNPVAPADAGTVRNTTESTVIVTKSSAHRRSMNDEKLLKHFLLKHIPNLFEKIEKPYKNKHHHLSRDGHLNKRDQTRQRAHISSQKYYSHSESFEDSVENDMLHKIREASSYSDEKDLLKNNLYNAFRHGIRTFASFRKSGGDINNKQTLRALSSETDEEWVLKNNIYKVFE